MRSYRREREVKTGESKRMSEDVQMQTGVVEPSEIQQAEPGPEVHDWFLQTFIDLTNDGDMEVGITLNVGGFLISGRLVGRAKYFEGIAAEFVSGFADPEPLEETGRIIAQYG